MNKICIDLGASQIKAIYQLDNGKPCAITLLPNLAPLNESRLTHYRNQLGLNLSEHLSWVSCSYNSSTAMATDELGLSFYEMNNLNKLKTDEGYYRIAATLGKILLVEKLLDRKKKNLPLSIAVLLPYNEFDKEQLAEFKNKVKSFLKKFYFRDEKVAIAPESLLIYPEGLGICNLTFGSNPEGAKIVVMCGHRNTSYLIFIDGQFKLGKSINLGFHTFLKEFCSNSVAQEENRRTFLTLWETRKDLNSLRRIVKTQIAANQEKEFNRLATTFTNCRKNLWLSIKEWLSLEVGEVVYNELIFAGGTSEFLAPYINEDFKMKKILPQILTQKYKETINNNLNIKSKETEDLAIRFVDCYGLFKSL